MKKAALPLSLILLAACSSSDKEVEFKIDIPDIEVPKPKDEPPCGQEDDKRYHPDGENILVEGTGTSLGGYVYTQRQFGKKGPLLTLYGSAGRFRGKPGIVVYGVDIKKGNCAHVKKKHKRECNRVNNTHSWKFGGGIIGNQRTYHNYLMLERKQKDMTKAVRSFYKCVERRQQHRR